MLKDYFEVPNKPAIKSGNVLSCDFTDHETFIPQPLDFTRNTLATYVDCNGLIKVSGITDTELVTNGDFSDGLNGWSSHNGSILELQDGKAKVTTVGTQGWIKRTDLPIQSGKTYFCKAEITNALNPVFFINGTTNQLNPMPLISGNLYGGYITTTGNNSIFYIKGNNTDGEVSLIDNVSVKEVDGNTPRIDYLTEINKSKELQKPSLLLEPQRTNTAQYSEDVTVYNYNDSTIRENVQIITPYGYKSNAVKIDAESGVNSPIRAASYSLGTYSANDVITLSGFVKYNGYRYVQFGGYFGNESARFDLINGVITQNLSNVISSSMVKFPNDWYKLTVTYTFQNNIGNGYLYAGWVISPEPDFTFTNSPSGGIYVWGLQAELGSYATSYIPTYGSAVTRNVELCDNAGKRGVFNNEEGTIYAEFTELGFTNPNQTSISVSQESSSNNRLLLFRGGGSNWSFQLRAAGVNVISNSINLTTTETLDKFAKVAIRYKSGEITAFVNGSQSFTNTSTFTFNSELFKFGFIPYDGSTGNNFYGRIKDIKVFRRTLTDSEMAELTNNIT